MLLTDAHTHLAPADRATGVRLVCGTSPADWEQVARLAEEDQRVIPFFGLHPWHVTPETWMRDLRLLNAFLMRFPHAGIGETGLDKCRRGIPDLPLQLEALHGQLELAARLNRPVALHCCRAWGSLAAAVKTRPGLRTIWHGWTGNLNPARDLPHAHWLLSIGPQNAGRAELLQTIPRDRLALESDDHPETLPETYQTAARAMGLTVDSLAQLAADNLARLLTPAP